MSKKNIEQDDMQKIIAILRGDVQLYLAESQKFLEHLSKKDENEQSEINHNNVNNGAGSERKLQEKVYK